MPFNVIAGVVTFVVKVGLSLGAYGANVVDKSDILELVIVELVVK